MTMEKFAPGQKYEWEVTITKEMSTNRTGQPGADVLSTPSMLGLMEGASIRLSEANMPEGYTTVGYAVDGLRHLAATPVGNKVLLRTELTEVDSERKRLTFKIEALEGEKTVGVAMHKRALIPTRPSS